MTTARGTIIARLVLLALALLPLERAAAQVRFDRAGFRLTSIGEQIAVTGRILDARRRPVANANIRYRVADPSIASVTSQGVVVSRRVGYTKLWAVAGRDSASAIIVVDQWAAKFDFSPSVVRLDAVGAKAPLRIFVRDAAGHLILDQTRKATACRSLNDRVATLAANGEVNAKSNGMTWVRCTDRGIADSVRVEVRQRAATATIADKGQFSTRMVGDSFRLRIRALDRSNDEIKDPQATWASLLPGVVTVDPLTGSARAIAPGDARIVAQAGDATDTLRITVQAPAGYVGPIVTADSAPPGIEGPKTASLKIASIFPFEGDTTTLQVTANDATGTAVANPDVRLRSSDTSIVVILSRNRVLPKKQGNAYVIGTFMSIVDSTPVMVRARSKAAGTVTAEATAAFVRPTFDTVALYRMYKASTDSARTVIFDSSQVAGLKTSGRLISFSGMAGPASHSFSDTTAGVESRTGLMYGGTAEMAPFRWLRISGDFRTGKLASADANGGSELFITEVEGDIALRSANFALSVGQMNRAVREAQAGSEPIALQKWSGLRVGASARFRFVGDALGTFIGVSVLPKTTYTGYLDNLGKPINPDPFSIAGEAGLDFRFGWLNIGMNYYAEKFTFKNAGSKRVDSFSAIRAKFGLQRNW